MITSSILARVGRQKAAPQAIAEGSGSLTWGAYGEVWADESRHNLVDAYRDRIWVRRCINLIANSMTQVGIKPMFKGEVVEDHPIKDLLKRPDPRDPALNFFEEAVRWGEITGDWFFEAIPARDGSIAQLVRLRADDTQIKPGKLGRPAGYVYDRNGAGDKVEYAWADPEIPKLPNTGPNAVIAGRYTSPIDDWYGMSPLRSAKDDIISEYHAVRYDHRFFRNSARPDVAVLFKNSLSDQERAKNKDAWQDFKGVDNSHKAAILSGDADIKLIGQNQKDVEYLNGRKLSREGQCGAHGVPPVLVGILDHATYSNLKEARQVFWQETMLNKLEFFAIWSTYTIVPYFEGVDEIAFDVSNIQALQESENEKTDRLVRGIAGGLLTPNEGRESLGLEPVDQPEADVIYLPSNVAAIDSPQDNQSVDSRIRQMIDTPSPQKAAVALLNKARNDDTPELSKYSDQREATLDKWSLETEQALAKIFNNAGNELIKIVSGDAKEVDIQADVDSYDWAGVGTAITATVGSMHYKVWEDATAQTAELLNLDVPFTGDAPEVQQMLAELANRPDGISTVQSRVKEDVIEQVQLGIAKGIPNRGIATGGIFNIGPPGDREAVQFELKGVKGVFEEYKTWQAERIARTESAVAYNRSSTLVMRDAGVTHVKIVDGTHDSDCEAANGSLWTLELFESNPIAHPNCRRLGLPVI